MKPVLKAPGTMLLKLRFDEPVSSFAFNCDLRRDNKGILLSREQWLLLCIEMAPISAAVEAGAYTRHFSAHHKRLLRDTLGGPWSISDKNGPG